MPQDDLAYEVGISHSYLGQLKKGAFFASLKIIGKLADVLGIEPSELLRLPKRGRAARKKARGTCG